MIQGLQDPSEQVQVASVRESLKEFSLSRNMDLLDELYAFMHVSNNIAALEMIITKVRTYIHLNDLPRNQTLIKALCRLLATFSDYQLITQSLEILEMFLSTKDPNWLQAAIEGNVFSIIFNLSGYPDDSIKISSMRLLRGFSHIAELQREIQSRGLLMLIRFLSNPIDGLRTAAAEILHGAASFSIDTRNSLIIWNFAPALIECLSGQYADVKNYMLDVLLLLLQDNIKANLDELVENNIITVLCRMAERDPPHRPLALKSIEVLVAMRNPLYSAILNSCRVEKLLDSIRSQGGDDGNTASEILRCNFAKYSHLPPIVPTPSPAPVAPIQVAIFPYPQTTITSKLTKPTKPRAPAKTSPYRPKVEVKRKGKSKLSSRNSIPSKCGLTLPVSRIDRQLRKTNLRVSRKASIYCTAALEYLTAEILECAGRVTKEASRKIISPRDILEAVRFDAELAELIKNTVLPETGNIRYFPNK